MFRRLTTTLAAVVATGLVLTGCGANQSATTPDTSQPLRIMADVTPHSVLLKEAQQQGLLGDVKIDITEISGDVDPNQLVNAGDLDANFFQHVPYLTDWNTQNDGDLVSLGDVHVEPLGLYSRKVTLDAVPNDAVIAIPADATNQARALFLLADAGLVTLDVTADQEGLDFSQVTPEKNVTGNPRNISWLKIDRPQLASTLDDPQVTLSVINGNYALEAGLTPKTDALQLESAENNPYANVLVVKESLKDDPRVVKVNEALTSPELQAFIEDTFNGSVLPAK